MIANYHTHTPRCRHAVGSEREYIETAIEKGLKILGFSDHVCYPFPSHYYSTFRMFPHELEDYITTVSDLKEEYKNEITIHLGFEAEYYPKYFDSLLRMLEPYPIEYLLLGQHFIGNEINEHYCGSMTMRKDVLTRYVSQVEEALKTGRFTYLAHPDLIYYRGADRELYKEQMRKLCKAANHYKIPIEINLLGLSENRNYPDPIFWQIAGEEQCRVILGSDAHRPAGVYPEDAIRSAKELADRNHLSLLETIDLIHPF